jgi:hypothetical protein
MPNSEHISLRISPPAAVGRVRPPARRNSSAVQGCTAELLGLYRRAIASRRGAHTPSGCRRPTVRYSQRKILSLSPGKGLHHQRSSSLCDWCRSRSPTHQHPGSRRNRRQSRKPKRMCRKAAQADARPAHEVKLLGQVALRDLRPSIAALRPLSQGSRSGNALPLPRNILYCLGERLDGVRREPGRPAPVSEG